MPRFSHIQSASASSAKQTTAQLVLQEISVAYAAFSVRILQSNLMIGPYSGPGKLYDFHTASKSKAEISIDKSSWCWGGSLTNHHLRWGCCTLWSCYTLLTYGFWKSMMNGYRSLCKSKHELWLSNICGWRPSYLGWSLVINFMAAFDMLVIWLRWAVSEPLCHSSIFVGL